MSTPKNPDPVAVAAPKPCRLYDLRPFGCRWIVKGEGASALFCNAETEPGVSWCDTHRARVFAPRR